MERERLIDARVAGVLDRNLSGANSPPIFGSLNSENAGLHTRTFRCDGAGATVVYSTKAIGGELCLVKPAVHHTKTEVCVFYGYLSNSEEVIQSLKTDGRDQSDVGLAQDGELAAELVLHMFRNTSTKDLLIMLSELQGQYAFVVYDSQRKQAFAARDPSGKETIYFHTNHDGGLSFTNQPFNVPHGEQTTDWDVVPPGHYIAGKTPRLKQFALTPEQLTQRKMYEESDGCPSPVSNSPESFGSWEVAPQFSCATEFQRAGLCQDVPNLFRISM